MEESAAKPPERRTAWDGKRGRVRGPGGEHAAADDVGTAAGWPSWLGKGVRAGCREDSGDDVGGWQNGLGLRQ